MYEIVTITVINFITQIQTRKMGKYGPKDTPKVDEIPRRSKHPL
jgi:hypothetical protein